MALTIGGRRVGGRGPATPLDPLEAKLADKIARILRALAASFDIQAYVDAIAALDPQLLERLLTEVDTGRLSVTMESTLADVFRVSGQSEYDKQARAARRPVMVGGGQFSYLPRPDALTYVDERAKMWAQTRSAELVREIDESNRLAIRQIIAHAFTGPVTVDQTAVSLRRVVGLHPRWAGAVLKFHDDMYVRLLKDGMTGFDAAQRAEALTSQYRNTLIRRRAQMIARTEIQQAQNWGRQAAWNAGSQSGTVDPAALKEWTTAPVGSRYGGPCETCMQLRGTRVPWNGVFANGQTMPPGHPNCRCTAVLVPPTRGLTGLPSQDLQPWFQQLDAMDAESAALSKAYQRKFSTVSEAARYAANIRWHGHGEGVPAAAKPAGGGEPGASGWNPRSGDPMPTEITGEIDLSDMGRYVGIRDRNDWATVAETFQDGNGVVLMRNPNVGGGTAGMAVGAAVMLEGGTWVLMDLTNTATGPLGKGDTLDPQSEQNLRSFATDVYGLQSRIREMLGDEAARQVNRGVAFTSRPNPTDAYWSEQYGEPVEAIASAGNNYITVWGRNGFVNPVTASTYLHETGHNVETRVFGGTGKAALTYDYTTAVMADYQFLEPDGKAAPVYGTLTQLHGGHPVKPEFDESAKGKNPYPYGITTYGKSSPAEEFAETFRLFGWSDWGDRSIGANEYMVDVRFEDLFPNRSRMMGEYVDAARSGRKIK